MKRFRVFITERENDTILTHKGFSVIHSRHSKEQMEKRGGINPRRSEYLFRKAAEHAAKNPDLHGKEAMFYSKSVDHAFVGAVDHANKKVHVITWMPHRPKDGPQKVDWKLPHPEWNPNIVISPKHATVPVLMEGKIIEIEFIEVDDEHV